ncbi:TPA: hypothetical protein KNH13_001893 [Clostridioides difficile]|uniref:hypothetical protein n=1 Tax=Clostridioides difficile TaxID=1496 RepID=UPI000B3C83DF|nr:hypothetical protein [Clostridioides difficile]MEC5403312.1 hypothetical protein [Clostridioides difficile]TLE39792.1 hypothetical protein EDC95_13735 [Clostridioides difficile]HBE9333772.1 hypothetical protein [Clostridioides difficile]
MKNNNELNEYQEKKIKEMRERIAREDAEKAAKKQQKEEERQARREARRKKKEERPFIIDVLSVVGQWIVVIAILAWLGTGAGDEIVAKLNGENTYKQAVLDTNLYDGITLGEACENFFGNYKSKYFKTEDDLNIVEVSGKAYFMDKKVNVLMQFVAKSRELGDFELYTSTINDVPQNAIMNQSLYQAICDSAMNMDAKKVDNTKVEDIQVGKEEDTATVMNSKYSFNSSTNKSVNKDNCIQLIKSSDYKGKKIGSSLDNYYDTTDWSFVSKDGNTYRVDMTADCDTEMYRIKITFVIDSKGNIGIDNAVMSSLDSTDAYRIDDEELNAILDQVF